MNGFGIISHFSGNSSHFADLVLRPSDLLLLPLQRRQHPIYRIGNPGSALRVLIHAVIDCRGSHLQLRHIRRHFADQVHQTALHSVKGGRGASSLVPALHFNILARQITFGHNRQFFLKLYNGCGDALRHGKRRRQNHNGCNHNDHHD